MNRIIDDLVLIAVVGIVVYLGWKFWLSNKISAVIATEKAALQTIGAAAASPADTVTDFWKWISDKHISQDDFRQNIAEIQAGLDGKKL